jgi:hypothetical protein
MRSLLFDVHTWDFWTMALVAAVLGSFSLVGQLDPRAMNFVSQSGQSVEHRIAESRAGQTRVAACSTVFRASCCGENPDPPFPPASSVFTG